MGNRTLGDRYELLHELGRGGMATVWRAHDRRLDRPVAVKIAHPDDAQLARRIEREARLAAGITHRSVVTVFDSGSEGGQPFLVMELLEGAPLSTVGGAYEGVRALELGAELADGLAAIHSAGIVHRDVKPGNVVITPDGPKLTDFGIARGTDTDRLTKTNQIVGTPTYVAPEVLSGNAFGPPADVYSLAVVMTELLTGGRPTPGLTQIDSGDPAVDAVIRSALDPDPAQRPSADEFAVSLRRGQLATATLDASPVSLPLSTAGRRAEPSEDTQVLADVPAPTDESNGRPAGRRWLVVAAFAFTFAAIGLAAALGSSLGDGGADTAASSSTPVPVETTAAPTVVEITPSTRADTTSTTTEATTTSTVAPGVEDAAADLLSWASDLRPNELKPKDRRKLFSLVDDLLRQEETRESRQMERQLEELERLIDRVDGDAADEGMELYDAFVEALL